MRDTHWLAPKFIGEGFSNFLFNLHRILLYTFYTLILSLPIITAGGAHLALFTVLRRLAEDDKATSKDYFKAFKSSILSGIPYGLLLITLIVAVSLPAKTGVIGFALIAGSFLIYTFLLFYPAVYNAGYRKVNAFVRAVAYSSAHIGESIFLVGIVILYLFVAYFLSEILLLLFYPLIFFITARIVVANNKEENLISQEEKIHEKVS